MYVKSDVMLTVHVLHAKTVCIITYDLDTKENNCVKNVKTQIPP